MCKKHYFGLACHIKYYIQLEGNDSDIWKLMALISGRNKDQISKESIEGKDPYMWYKNINFSLTVDIRVVLFWLDTQDKQTHKTYGKTKYSFEELFYACLFRLDTQDKRTRMRHGRKNFNSKSSTCVFLDWTHKTNGQTRQNR